MKRLAYILTIVIFISSCNHKSKKTTESSQIVNDEEFLIDSLSTDSVFILDESDTTWKYDLQGTMINNITIDLKTGWIIEAKLTQSIKGTAEVKDNPQMPGGMIIPMTISNKMTMTN